MIQVSQLQKSYNRQPVLNNLTFEVRPSELTLMVGINGAGKSTALKIICGILSKNHGDVWINGYNQLQGNSVIQRQLSFLPQGIAFHPGMKVWELLRFYARLRDVPMNRAEAQARRWGLESFIQSKSSELSGGLRQRLGLAVLMMADSPVLVLDEPGLSLDPQWRVEMQECLLQEARRGKTVLIATHLLGEWENRAQRCLHIQNGRLVGEFDSANLRNALLGKDETAPSSFQIGISS